MATSEPADEEDLPTFYFFFGNKWVGRLKSPLASKGFLTPEKKKLKNINKEIKKRIKREQASPVSSCLTKSAINFQTPVSLSQRENT